MKKPTVGEVFTKHVGSEKHEPTHFFSKATGKVHGIDMRPHLKYAANILSRWQAGQDVWPHAKRKKRGI